MEAIQISWKESFGSGFPPIDDQHKQLISLINELFGRLAENCPVEDVRYYLSHIHELIDFHFREEEAVMRQCQYAGYARHKADHDRLLQEIGDIRRTLTEESDSPQQAALAKTIEDWFSIHFRSYDKAFHEFGGAA